jgi:glycerol kinase
MLLAIDQGTTSSRAILFRADGRALALSQAELPQHFPRPGWVEHDPDRIWTDTLAVCRTALREGGAKPDQIAGIGITNQRETTVLWERATGRPVHPAIVWQDRRTASMCERLREEGLEPLVRERTGLLVDPYFSATKLVWLLENVDGARPAAERGELAFGTVDTWLLWQLSGGRVHATDATNAARTMLFDIHRQVWDEDLLAVLEIPRAVLPEVRDSSGFFGETDPQWFGQPLPITGIAGDQQAATFGQAAFEPGMTKSTYGTGCFVLMNTGDTAVASANRLLTTVAWRLGGEATYALEGSIFVAGAAVQWLRDGLGIISRAAETETLAESIDDTGGVYLVPGFVGLGAPYWDAEARGAILGTPSALRVDGGLAANAWAMQFLADVLDLPVERPVIAETTALGAASLAGLEAGVFDSLEDIARAWQRDARWTPSMSAERRDELYEGWRRAVRRVLDERD